jgi:hypothetical protein
MATFVMVMLRETCLKELELLVKADKRVSQWLKKSKSCMWKIIGKTVC